MKVVKLNKTHRLFHLGCSHALRFGYRSKYFYNINSFLKTSVSFEYQKDFFVFRSKRIGPTWIGFKSDLMMTMALLSVTE